MHKTMFETQTILGTIKNNENFFFAHQFVFRTSQNRVFPQKMFSFITYVRLSRRAHTTCGHIYISVNTNLGRTPTITQSTYTKVHHNHPTLPFMSSFSWKISL